MKKKFKNLFIFLTNSKLFIFAFFLTVVFVEYRQLFQSYFEADEWFHFTRYIPLLSHSNSALLALAKSVTDTIALSEGQHVDPIAEEIFFLNLKFFGINFIPYAFISLLTHSVNSFLTFLLIRELFGNSHKLKHEIFAVVGGIFFALTAIPMHVVTWAAFYGQNTLSVTFFILSILFFKKAFNGKKRKYLIFSSIFFLLDLLTKETAVVLVFVLPLVVLLEKKIFSRKTIAKIFLIPLVFFAIFRFAIPAIYFLVSKWIDSALHLTVQNPATSQIIQKGGDLSLVIYRLITFPLSMASQVFISSATMFSIMKIITPFIYYQYPGEPESRSQYRQFFIYGPGNSLLFYLIAFGIIAIVISLVRHYFAKKNNLEAHALILGFSIVIISALPLVLNVLYLPWWGTEYFDSRHYYMPSVGAAVVFPFILFSIVDFMSNSLRKITRIQINQFIMFFLLFVLWLTINKNVFDFNLHTIIDLTGYPRKQIITQMKHYLPVLPEKAVIYSETDGKGAYGPLLPFQTSFPQILTIVYYPFPDSFYNKFIFNAKPEGYFFSQGRGLGYYNSKKSLREAVLTNQFSVENIYGFYYDSQKIKLKNITDPVREEMKTIKNLRK